MVPRQNGPANASQVAEGGEPAHAVWPKAPMPACPRHQRAALVRNPLGEGCEDCLLLSLLPRAPPLLMIFMQVPQALSPIASP